MIIDLAGGFEIALGVYLEGEAFVGVGVVSELRPIGGVEAGGVFGERGGGVDGLVTGEDAAAEEAVAFWSRWRIGSRRRDSRL